MPNTLTSIFRSVPSTEPVEAPHPNTGTYVTGTQLADGTWQVVHTAITKTASPLTMTGRLKNFPAITASIIASGNILNIQQAAPTGLSAVGSSTTSINVTGSSSANAAAYRFLSGSAQAGPFTLLVTQASATYNHTGLAGGAVVWYQMQYVGGGFYDDSPVSVSFSGTAAVASFANADIASIPPAQSNGSGFSDTTQAAYTAAVAQFPNARVGIWNKAAGAVQVYQPGTNDQGIPAGTVAGYPRGFGPDLGFAIAWLADSANAARTLVFFKTDLTPPLSTNGSSIAVWNSTLKAPDFADHANFVLYMQGKSWGNGVSNFSFPDLGEADSASNNTNYQADFTALIADFQAHGYYDANTKFTIPLLLRVAASFPNDAMINNAKAAFVNARTNAQTMTITSPVFNPADNTHYNADSQLRRGQQWYLQRLAASATTSANFTTLVPNGSAVESNAFTFAYTNQTVRSFVNTIKCVGPSTKATVTLYSSRAAVRTQGNSCTAYLDGVFLQQMNVTASGVNQDFLLTFPAAAGNRTLKIVQGSVAQASGTVEQPLVSTTVQQIIFDQTMSLSPAQGGSGVPVIMVLGDSKSVADYCPAPEVDGWLPKLRALEPTWFVVSSGWGGRMASLTIGTAAQRDTMATQAYNIMGGATSPVLYYALGLNDKAQNTLNPTDLATTMGTFFDLVRVKLANIKIIIETPALTTNNESANTLGFTLDQYRTAIAGVSIARSAWVHVQDGKALLTTSTADLIDGVHYTPAGNTTVANAVHTKILNFIAGSDPAYVVAGTAETTFADTFPAAPSVARWNNTSLGTGKATGSTTGLILQQGLTAAAEGNRAQYTSAQTYSMVGKSLVANVASIPNSADPNAAPFFLSVGAARASANSVGLAVQGNVLYAEVCDGSFYTTAPYVAANMKYLRLRFSTDGLTWYGEYSADNVTYTTVVTRALGGVSMAAATIILSAFQSNGSVVQGPATITSLTLA